MKITVRKDTRETVYSQQPDFEEGKGILNAVAIHGGNPEDYNEVEITALEYAAMIAPTYQELRAKAYPKAEDQLDMLYWDKVNGTDTWKEYITSVKRQYPKEENK